MEEALTPIFISFCIAGYIGLIGLCIWLFNYFLKSFKEQASEINGKISIINSSYIALKNDIINIKLDLKNEISNIKEDVKEDITKIKINMTKIEEGLIHVIKNDKSAVEALLEFTREFGLKKKRDF